MHNWFDFASFHLLLLLYCCCCCWYSNAPRSTFVWHRMVSINSMTLRRLSRINGSALQMRSMAQLLLSRSHEQTEERRRRKNAFLPSMYADWAIVLSLCIVDRKCEYIKSIEMRRFHSIMRTSHRQQAAHITHTLTLIQRQKNNLIEDFIDCTVCLRWKRFQKKNRIQLKCSRWIKVEKSHFIFHWWSIVINCTFRIIGNRSEKSVIRFAACIECNKFCLSIIYERKIHVRHVETVFFYFLLRLFYGPSFTHITFPMACTRPSARKYSLTLN